MKKHWITLSTLLALLATTHLHGQTDGNLVYNPSFEEYAICPGKIDAVGKMQQADAWWQPTNGSSDYFNACGGHETRVPRNKMGYQKAHTGNAYCGIYCSQEFYREYLQTELKQPLQSGRRYRVSFWVSLAEKSPHAIATLGALLTEVCATDSTRGVMMEREERDLEGNGSQSIGTYFEPQVLNPNDSLLDNTKEWVEIAREFVAKGGERFLTIGNFLPFNKSNVIATQGANTPLPGAYYYIDDVCVTYIDTIEQVIVPKKFDVPEVGAVVRMENVFFATGESVVLQQSYNELQRLLQLLHNNPGLKIEVRGHTDNQGTIDYNQRLSEARAKAIVEYLVKRGIDKRRLAWSGHGKSKPVADNGSAEGRRQNRRVEFCVIAR